MSRRPLQPQTEELEELRKKRPSTPPRRKRAALDDPPHEAPRREFHAGRCSSPGPATRYDRFVYMPTFLDTLVASLGRSHVEGKLRKFRLVLDTLFSGVDCPVAAALALEAGVKNFLGDRDTIFVHIGIACEKDVACQRVLGHLFYDRCIFDAVESLVLDSSEQFPRFMLKYCTSCMTHPSGQCEFVASRRRREGHQIGLVLGPPCVAHARRGKRLGFADPRTHCHQIAKQLCKDSGYDWFLFENVDGYPLEDEMKDIKGYYVQVVEVSPIDFGYKCGRKRKYVSV